MNMQMKKGVCGKKRKFYGMATITERGQIVIPQELRNDLDIKNGDKLLLIKRDDCKGLNLIKSDTIDSFIDSISKE